MPNTVSETYTPLDAFLPYQTPRLLAIVGSNPLPAHVAATLLASPGGTVTLICTAASRDVATKLIELLEKLGIACEPVLLVDEANRFEMFRLIQAKLGDVSDLVGLNYTGGTKSMSVHIYRAVEAWAVAKNAPHPVFSYIDPRRRAVVFDPKPGEIVSTSVPIPAVYPMHLCHLIEMHGWIQTQQQTEPILVGVADALCALYGTSVKAPQSWKTWKEKIFKPACWDRDKFIGNLDTNLPLPSGQEIAGVRKAIEAALSPLGRTPAVVDGQIVFRRVQACCGITPKELCEFLDGKWLESSVLQALQRCQKSHHLKDLGMSLKAYLMNNSNINFELDGVALHGYQLFAFSCGSGTYKGELKKKLFEVYSRAQQIGGDEARIALVSPYHAPNDLRDEISGDIGKQGHIRVFGWQDLADLETKISDWIGEEIKAIG